MALAALLLSVLIAALILVAVIGVNPEQGDMVAYLGFVFVMCLLGPLLFAWAWGPGTIDPIALVLAFGLPTLSMVAFYLGFVKARQPAWLMIAAVLWAGFGGFSAWVAITGSV